MRSMLFLPPLIQLLVFGYAVNLDVDHSTLAWVDRDQTPESRELLAAFQGSGRFELIATPASDEEAQAMLDGSKVDTVITVLPGFERDILRGRTTSVQILLNGTNSNTASIISGYANSIVAGFAAQAMEEQNRQRLAARLLPAPARVSVPKVNLQSRVWFNPDLRSRNYFVPGVVVNIITVITLMLTAMSIVREKEIGTMEQLMVTPLRPVELILGKTLPFVVIGFWDMILVVSAALLIFRVPFVGNFGLLCLAALLFILTTLGAGLFISTVSRTQQQANMSTFLFFQPFMMLSGFTFPIRNMPEVVQWFTYINPMRYFMEIVRGIFLKGSGLDTLWPNFAGLGVLGVTVLWLAVQRFHKHLE